MLILVKGTDSTERNGQLLASVLADRIVPVPHHITSPPRDPAQEASKKTPLTSNLLVNHLHVSAHLPLRPRCSATTWWTAKRHSSLRLFERPLRWFHTDRSPKCPDHVTPSDEQNLKTACLPKQRDLKYWPELPSAIDLGLWLACFWLSWEAGNGFHPSTSRTVCFARP